MITATDSTSAPCARPPAYRGVSRHISLRRTAGRDLAYITGVLGMSIAGFVMWTAGASITLSLVVLVVGAFVWLPVTAGLRALADRDRDLVGWYLGRRIHARYRRQPSSGLVDRLRTVTTDPSIWRDLRWLMLNSVFGFLAATAALAASLEVITLITTPLWWWALNDPHHQYATLNLGIYTVTSTGWALATTGLGLALAPVAIAINHGTAVAHANLAQRLLGDG
jgi:hypothetical protein